MYTQFLLFRSIRCASFVCLEDNNSMKLQLTSLLYVKEDRQLNYRFSSADKRQQLNYFYPFASTENRRLNRRDGGFTGTMLKDLG